jgi:hypothetical protein
VGKVKQFKYSALVRLNSPSEVRAELELPVVGGRVVVRARHHDTRMSKIFSALVSNAQDHTERANRSIQLTLTVLGDDAGDYLDAGDSFTLWRGHDIGQGVISRRLSWWADAP